MATHLLNRRRADSDDQLPLGASRNEAIFLILAVLVLALIGVSFWFQALH